MSRTFVSRPKRKATSRSRTGHPPAVDRSLFRSLLLERLEGRLLLTTVSSVVPAANSFDSATSTNVSATFDEAINPATATTDTLVVSRQQVGQLTAATATVSTDGQTITLDPSADFLPGEIVKVTATNGILSTGGNANTPRVWEFRTEVSGGSALFSDSGQVLGTNQDGVVRFGDLDSDGDQDAVWGGRFVWLNDGSGSFTDSGQTLGNVQTDLADVDGDGDLDVIDQNNVFLNDGNAVFSPTGQDLTPSGGGTAVEAGDIDGDGDTDVMVGIAYGGNLVWQNNGNGNFTNTGQSLGNSASFGIGFGDFDDDGDLDAFTANNGAVNRVWFNDGSGNFSDSNQALGGIEASQELDIGDVDGDGDLDVLVSNNPGTFVWINDGSGVFTDSGQRLNPGTSNEDVKLGDLDADGDLDAYVTGWNNDSQIWLNDGLASFSQGQSLNFSGLRRAGWVGLADIDSDGDLDAFEGNRFSGGARVWINQNLEPSVTLSVAQTAIAEAGGVTTVTATLSQVHTQPVTVNLATSGLATLTDDFTISGTQILVPVGSTTGSVTLTAVQDAIDEPDETVIVEIASVTGGQEAGNQQVTVTIQDDDEPVVPDVTLTVDSASIEEAGGVATFTATLSEVTNVAVTVDLALSGTAVAGSDYNASGTQIVIGAGASAGSITVTAVDDDEDEQNETVIVDILAVSGGNEAGTQQQVTTITDNDAPPGLAVTSLTATTSGFVAELSTDLDPSALNLYDTETLQLGAADATLIGASNGPITGSLVIDSSLRSVTFVKSEGPLQPDSYTVTLRSADNGFKDGAGRLLDGNGDGTGGDDYRGTFEVAEPAAGTITVSVPDFTRGPGQEVHLPADTTNGIPITISNGENVRAIDLRIAYDPAMLSITGATVGADMPSGASVVLNSNTPGLAILVFFSSTALPTGSSTFVNLQATIPTANAGEVYGTQQTLDLHGATVSDGTDNEIPVLVDDAFHLASYFGDVSGNGRINAADASQVARFAAFVDSGFSGSLLADPLVAGDVSGNRRINAADASLVAQFAARIDVPVIPPIPGGIVLAGMPKTSPGVDAAVLARQGDSTTGKSNGQLRRHDDVTFLVVEDFSSIRDSTNQLDERRVDAALADDGTLISSLEAAIEELAKLVE